MKKLIFSALLSIGFVTVYAQTTWLQQTTNATGVTWRSGNVGLGYTNATTSPPTLYARLQSAQTLSFDSEGLPIPSTTPEFRIQRTYGATTSWWHLGMGTNDFTFSSGTGLTSTVATPIMSLLPTGIRALKNLTLTGGSNLILEAGGTLMVKGSAGLNVFKVFANGDVRARDIQVDLDVIPDFVFDPEYKLMPIYDLKIYLAKHKHLPEVKSAKEYEEQGFIDLKEMNLKLLQKVEELTLYTIQMQEQIDELKKQVSVNKQNDKH